MDDRLDLIVARAAAEQGLLDWPILEEALEKQRALVLEGQEASLSELLGDKSALNPDTIRALLAASDRAILRCNSCGHHFTIYPYVSTETHLCSTCATALVEGDLLDPDVLEKAIRVFAAGLVSLGASTPGATSRPAASPRTASGKIAILPGTRLKHYEILEKVGEGGMGIVFKARHTELNTMVAIKVMYPDRAGSEARALRFQREAKAAGRLRHPNIVAIHDVDQAFGVWYIVMDYVAGPTLAQHINHKHLPAPEAARISHDVGDAIHYAHTRGVIHRDLKPSNILIDSAGTPFVMDFGLAKEVDAESHLTVTGAIMGTPLYMSPEQAKGQTQLVDEQSDVYALGAILYETLTGRPPFSGANMAEILRKVISEHPSFGEHDQTHIPIELQAIALKAMEKARVRRYRSAREFALELERFQKGQPVHARPTGALDQVRRFAAARKKPLGIGTAILAALAGIGGYVAWEQKIAWEAAQNERVEARKTHCSTAGVLLGERRWTDAKEEAEAALGIAKGLDAYVLLGRATLGAGNFEAAEKAFDSAIELDGNNVGALLGHGQALVGLRQEVEALRDFDGAAARAPGDPAPRAAAGIVRARLAEFRRSDRAWLIRALEDCTAALEGKGLVGQTSVCPAGGTQVSVRRARAGLLVLLGRHTEAVADYEALLLHDPSAQTTAELGLAALASGDIARAESCQAQLALYDPPPPEAMRLKARIQAALGQVFESSVTAWALLETVRGDTVGRLLTANYQREHGEWPESNGSYSLLVENDPNAEVYRERGQLFERWGKLDRAADEYGKAAAFDPDDALAVYDRGRVRLAQHDEPAAAADWEKAFQMRPAWREWHVRRYGRPFPENPAIIDLSAQIAETDAAERRLARGRLYRACGKTKEALDDFASAIAQTESPALESAAEAADRAASRLARLARAETLLGARRWEEALADFKVLCAAEAPDDVSIWGAAWAAQHLASVPHELPTIRPVSPRARLYAGFACVGASRERRDLALRDLASLLAENPTTLAEVSFARGLLYTASAERDRVVSGPSWATAANAYIHLTLACELLPEDPAPLQALTGLWWGFGDKLCQSSWLGENQLRMWRDPADGHGLKRSRDMLGLLLDRLISNGDRSLFYMRALAQVEDDKDADAIEMLTRALDAGPQVDPEKSGWRPGEEASTGTVTKSQILAKRSRCRETLKDIQGAIEDLTQAFEAEPTETEFLIRRAELRRSSGDLAGAAEDYGEAIAAAEAKKVWSGTLLGYYRKRGFLWIDQEKFDEAERDFKHALELQASGGADWTSNVSDHLSYGLSRCAAAKKDWPEAWTRLNEAFQAMFFPWLDTAVLDYIDTLEKGSGESAEQHVSKEAWLVLQKMRVQRAGNRPPPPVEPPPPGEGGGEEH